MKNCKCCNTLKSLNNFSKGKSTCKPCASILTQLRNKTPRGIINMMYSNQLMTSRKMKRDLPNYTQKQLYDWVISQKNWSNLFYAWVRNNYDKAIKPSCDRIDSGKPYTLDNLQLVTFSENLLNRGKECRLGLNLGKNGKKVKRITKTGEVVEYDSVLIAMRSLGKNEKSSSNIHTVCSKPNRTAYGYYWEYV